MQEEATDFFENLEAMYQNTGRHIPPSKKKVLFFNTHCNDSLISRVEKTLLGKNSYTWLLQYSYNFT
jgi:hypothetical protein